MASREELISSIQPGVKLDKSIFLRIYGYGITTPEFVKKALDKLEDIYDGKSTILQQSFLVFLQPPCSEHID